MGIRRDTPSRLLVAASLLFWISCIAHTAETPGAGNRIVDGTNVPESQFPTVGKVGDANEHFCTGTLISPTHVLAAAHCISDDNGRLILGKSEGRFTLGGQTYSTVDIIVHPSYDGSDSEGVLDLSILVLDRPVPGVTPTPIYRQTPVVGQLLTIAGFGVTGTGSGGVSDNSPVPADGTINFGTTPLDIVTSTFLKWNFDNRTGPDKESNTAPGDSGGPAFITVNGVLHLAGVTSGGTLDNAGFGDLSYDTRVDIAAAWIDSIAGTSSNTPPPNTGTLQIVSGPNFSPAVVFPQDVVTFAVAANLSSATFHWNFGDGSDTASGSSVSHTFSSDGNYFVTVTASDAGGASATASVVVQVGDGGNGGNGGDSGGEGVNAEVFKSKFSLNFTRQASSRIDFSMYSEDFFYFDKFEFTEDVDGQAFEVFIGNTRVDEMEFFGARAVGSGSLRWNIRNGEISYRLKSSRLPEILNRYGAKNADDFSSVTVPIKVRFYNTNYMGSYSYRYKARAGRTGTGK